MNLLARHSSEADRLCIFYSGNILLITQLAWRLRVSRAEGDRCSQRDKSCSHPQSHSIKKKKLSLLVSQLISAPTFFLYAVLCCSHTVSPKQWTRGCIEGKSWFLIWHISIRMKNPSIISIFHKELSVSLSSNKRCLISHLKLWLEIKDQSLKTTDLQYSRQTDYMLFCMMKCSVINDQLFCLQSRNKMCEHRSIKSKWAKLLGRLSNCCFLAGHPTIQQFPQISLYALKHL